MEDATEKAAVTPGPIKPARELLGDMLLQVKRPAEALVEFEATLKKEPNRFRATYGAARAAAAAGRRAEGRGTLREPGRARREGRPAAAEGSDGGAGASLIDARVSDGR